MLILSPVLVASPPAGSPNAPLVGWRNIVTVTNIAADFEAMGYPATNLANPSTAIKWVGAGWEDDSPPLTEQYVTVTTGTLDPIDYLAVARHNFGSGGMAVSVEVDEGDSVGFVAVTDPVVPADDSPLLFRFEVGPYVAVRLKIEAGSEAPEAAVVYVGLLLALQRNIYVGHRVLPYNMVTRVTNGRSESGQFLGRIVTGQYVESGLDLQNITPAFYRTHMVPWLRAAVESPWFFAWRPGDHPTEVGFCSSTSEPNMTNSRSNGMVAVSVSMTGVA